MGCFDFEIDELTILPTSAKMDIARFRKRERMKTFILSEADIQSIINGRDVIKQDGNSKVLIRQSYVKDIVAPIIKDKFVVRDSEFENRIRTANNNIINPLF